MIYLGRTLCVPRPRDQACYPDASRTQSERVPTFVGPRIAHRRGDRLRAGPQWRASQRRHRAPAVTRSLPAAHRIAHDSGSTEPVAGRCRL